MKCMFITDRDYGWFIDKDGVAKLIINGTVFQTETK